MQQDLPTDQSYQPLHPHHLAHDLRGPLNSLLGFTELLLEGIEGPLNEVQKEDLTAMWQSAHNLLNLINTYVDLSRLNAGLLNLEAGPVNCGDALKLVVQNLSATESAAGITFKTATPEHLPSVSSDFNRLIQMISLPAQFLMELLRQGTVEFGAARADDNVNFTILAAEVILTPSQLAELFEQTVRVDAAGRSRLTAGGIHLPLAYQLALRHNGTLNAASSPETGTRFTLSLPVYHPD
jgi:signal transduction histidine kinase